MRRLAVPIVSVLILVGALVTIWLISQPVVKSVAVITFIDHPVLNTIETSFKKRLADLMIQPNSVKIVTSNAQGRLENLPDICAQALRGRPDVIVSISTPVSQAVMRLASKDQRIVYTFVTNPGDLGDELTRANSTGLSDAVNYAANVNFIRSLFGEGVVIGMIFNPDEANSVFGLERVTALTKGTKTGLVKGTVRRETDIPEVAGQIAGVVNVFYVGGDNTVVGAIPLLLSVGESKGVPVTASDVGSIEAGALGGVSVNYEKLGQQTAEVVYEVLNGKEPRDIPRITLSGDQMIINLDAASRFGVSIPDSILQRADRVIGLAKGK